MLDLGCGAGENSLLLSLLGANVYALDISPELIELAKKRFEINHVSAAHKIDLPDGSVDIVFGIAILHHLDLNLVSKEVSRVLRKGGRAIFMEPVRDSAVIRFIRKVIPSKTPGVSPFEHPLTTRELERFSAPFTTCQIRAFEMPLLRTTNVLPGSFVSAVRKMDRALLNAIPFLSRYAARVFQITK